MLNKHYLKKRQKFTLNSKRCIYRLSKKKEKKNELDNSFYYKQNSLSGKKKYNLFS